MIEPFRVVEDSPMGFSFEKYADSEVEAFQILGRLVQERIDQNRPCKARIEICVNHRYKPLSEHSKLPPNDWMAQNIPLGVSSVQPSYSERIEWVCDRRLSPTKLRSIGASRELSLTEFRMGMRHLALKSNGDLHTPLPLQEIDFSKDLATDLSKDVASLDERLQAIGPIPAGYVVCATIRNDGPMPARVALVLSAVSLPSNESEE